jgi:hypothetical protein
MKKLLAFLLVCVTPSCIQGNVQPLDICSTRTLKTVPVVRPAGQPFKVGYIVREAALSRALAKIKDFGDVNVTLTAATFSTVEGIDLSFISKVVIGFVNPDGSILPLGEATGIAGDKIVYKFSNVPETVQQALLDGPVKFHTTISGVLPSVPVTPTLEVCAIADSTIDLHLSDLE